MTSALLWAIIQRRLVIPYGRFETTYRSHHQGSTSLYSWASCPLKMGPKCCPETSVRNYHSTLSTSPEERRSLDKLTVTCSKHCIFGVNTGNTAGNKAAIK